MKQDHKAPTGIDRLPAKFRNYISALESEVRRLHTEQDSQTQTRTLYDAHGAGKFLRDASIRFFPESHDVQRSRFVEVRLTDDGMLYVYGETRLAVFPESSNVFKVRLVPL